MIQESPTYVQWQLLQRLDHFAVRARVQGSNFKVRLEPLLKELV